MYSHQHLSDTEVELRLIANRVFTRGLLKKLDKEALRGDLTCTACGHGLDPTEAEILQTDCGHDVVVLYCPDEDCSGADGILREPAAFQGHSLNTPGSFMSRSVWDLVSS